MSLMPHPLAFAVVRLLAAEYDHRDVLDVAPWVDAVVAEAIRAGVDPRLVVAVGYVESRYRPVLGDGGRACGVYQYHVRFWGPLRASRAWRSRMTRRLATTGACELLRADPETAARAAVERLAAYADRGVCHYNQGTRCVPGETYTARVERVMEAL
jgi:hypothetical protein